MVAEPLLQNLWVLPIVYVPAQCLSYNKTHKDMISNNKSMHSCMTFGFSPMMLSRVSSICLLENT